MIQLIRGFKDILPDEITLWQMIERKACEHFENFGYKEIRLPILEKSELFSRSIGEETDIVEKEMYTFSDRKGDLITLRPEATASVVRSYIQHKMYSNDPIQKFYTIGPMFRRERPQKGRYRQFYQIDAEIFGIDSPYIDAQIIYMLMNFFKELEVKDIEVHINSLGCPKCRPKFQTQLANILASSFDQLCDNCQRRSKKNPLRVLDCKAKPCRDAMAEAPSIIDFLCTECHNHFNTVQDSLKKMSVPFIIDKRLVRGLDYYTRTAFEIQTSALGAQNAVAGGGRYDGLVKALGGPNMPAIGFAIGFDRLVEIISQNMPQAPQSLDLFIIALDDQSKEKAFEWICSLNLAGIKAEINYGARSLKSLMKRADKLNAKYVVISGEDEISKNSVILRNMENKEQIDISMDTLVEDLKQKILSGRS